MKIATHAYHKGILLPALLGFCDGILTALVLAANRIMDAVQPMTLSLAFRIAAVALFSGAFVFFVARYAELRGELIRAERQLNLTSHGRLAAGALGLAVRKEAMLAAGASSSTAFCGALVPLLAAALVPNCRWTSIITALVVLASMGIGLSRALHGSPIRWLTGLVIGVFAFVDVPMAYEAIRRAGSKHWQNALSPAKRQAQDRVVRLMLGGKTGKGKGKG